ncbi:uncharacterized protein LOC133891624 [Phragmites australis]|uniref:uncharacterized protein LOC133891624 n=1 Tax=Phragmites australis TaxID=29695 RepID=UPI002D79805F|nr:uncharacterized protein LOC133891624 [Phragmites australis]XP_062188336.1 uncharacterized protein LOC133891624 [Phragmites australis]XP_062188337.1 uncharacterized protein LOC133891624 [Phragmites australis]
MAPPPPPLMDDLVGEILLRLPPEEPANLFRATLVCKPWFRILSDPAFRRRYRLFHRTPPMLGIFQNLRHDNTIPRFVPTAATVSPCSPPSLDCWFWWALDCRHGRVLIYSIGPTNLFVWDPITGDQQHLPVPAYAYAYCTAAVLCTAARCDHLDCRGNPFLVVFVGTGDRDGVTWASSFLSETGAWSTPTTVDLSASTTVDVDSFIDTRPSILNGDALYFTLERGKSILKYDLGERDLSVIDAPVCEQTGIIMTAEDGGLGFAGTEGNSLHLWSWLAGDDSVVGWVLCRVIKLETLLPIHNPYVPPQAIGFAEGTDTIFLDTDVAVFTLELKSGKTRVWETGGYYSFDFVVIPFMSFCTPDLAMGRLLLP